MNFYQEKALFWFPKSLLRQRYMRDISYAFFIVDYLPLTHYYPLLLSYYLLCFPLRSRYYIHPIRNFVAFLLYWIFLSFSCFIFGVCLNEWVTWSLYAELKKWLHIYNGYPNTNVFSRLNFLQKFCAESQHFITFP